MVEHDRMTAVEMTITVGFDMTAWRDTLNRRVNHTGWQETWCTLLLERTSAGKTVHVWVKHGVILTCI